MFKMSAQTFVKDLKGATLSPMSLTVLKSSEFEIEKPRFKKRDIILN